MPSFDKLSSAFGRVPANVQGMLWIALSGLIFATFMAIVRQLGSTMDPIQTSFLRYAIGLLFLLPFFLKTSAAEYRAVNWKLHLLRGVLHGTGVMLWFYAMSRITLAEVSAIGFSSPVYATLGAAIFLGEKIRLPRITAVAMGLFGALLIVRPGFVSVDPGAIAMLVAAPIFAAADLCMKALTRKESGPAVVAYLSIVVTVVTAGPAIAVWEWPSLQDWALVTVVALLATVGHLAMTQGFKVGELTAVMPARYLQLLWSALLGYVIFTEVPSIYTWAGAGLIIAASLYIAHRESRSKAEVPPVAKAGGPEAG